jgi:hypothetical protein
MKVEENRDAKRMSADDPALAEAVLDADGVTDGITAFSAHMQDIDEITDDLVHIYQEVLHERDRRAPRARTTFRGKFQRFLRETKPEYN